MHAYRLKKIIPSYMSDSEVDSEEFKLLIIEIHHKIKSK